MCVCYAQLHVWPKLECLCIYFLPNLNYMYDRVITCSYVDDHVQIVGVNLTSEGKTKIEVGMTLTFTYQVQLGLIMYMYHIHVLVCQSRFSVYYMYICLLVVA